MRAISPRAAVVVLTGSGHESKTYVITGPEALTYAEIADKLSSAMGRTVTYVDTPIGGREEGLAGWRGSGVVAEGQMEQFRYRWQGKQSRVTLTTVDVAWKDPITFASFARDFATYFRGDQPASGMTIPLPSSR